MMKIVGLIFIGIYVVIASICLIGSAGNEGNPCKKIVNKMDYFIRKNEIRIIYAIWGYGALLILLLVISLFILWKKGFFSR